MNSGRTKDAFLAAVARNIFMVAATSDIYLHIVYIPGKSNVVADLLSRWEPSAKNNKILLDNVGSVNWL